LRLVVITGVTRGLGRAMAERFAQDGHTVLGCGRSLSAVKDLQYLLGKPHCFSLVDVADAAQVQKWAEKLLADYGAPDLVINNAALTADPAPLWTVSESSFSSVIDTNIKGVFHVIRSFAPAMISRRTGVIVNISSAWGRSTDPNVAPYCATKWAIEGLTQAFAQELPQGMATVALNPGIINTDMLRQCFGEDASAHATPGDWVQRAVPFILQLGPRDNGKSLNVPN